MGRYLGGGLDLFDEDNDRFLHYRDGDLNSVNSNFILTMEEDSDGDLWVGTSYGVNVLHKRTGRFLTSQPIRASKML